MDAVRGRRSEALPSAAGRDRGARRGKLARMTRPPHLTRRAALGLTILFGSSACGLRLEHDSPLPGPKASSAPDSRPLAAVRAHLVDTMAAASRETTYAHEAAAVQPLHREQLRRLDATLKGLDAKNLPSATATSDPSVTASASASAGASASGASSPGSSTPASSAPEAAASGSPSPSKSSSAAGGASTSSSPASTTWTKAEAAWSNADMCRTLAAVSSHSRPLVVAIAARGLAALPHDAPAAWPEDAAVQPGTTMLAPIERLIDALEWLTATTAVDDRGDLPKLLRRLYASRSLIEAGDLAGSGKASDAAQRYASAAEARKAADTASQALASACASAASTTPSARHVAGLLDVWATAIAAQQFAGSTSAAFPGLAA